MRKEAVWAIAIAAIVVIAGLIYFYGRGSYQAPSTTPTITPSTTPSTTTSVNTAYANPYVSSLGTILVDRNGMTLYVKSGDVGSSSCYNTCASTWPPLTTPRTPLSTDSSVQSQLGTITRTDGTVQVTYNNKPLYLYSGDSSAGQMNGNGIGGIWSVVIISSPNQSTPSPQPNPYY